MLPITADDNQFDSINRIRTRREKRRRSRERSNSLVTSALQGLRLASEMGGGYGEQWSSEIASPVAPRQQAIQALSSPQINISGDKGNSTEQAVKALLAEAGGKVKITSGRRSTQRQAQLWQAALRKYGSAEKARKWVAPPGRSKHERGEAYDLGGDLALAAKLAPKYGLYRPMKHEPWHFEKIGSRN